MKRLVLMLAVAIAFAVPSVAQDIYARFDAIEGEAMDKDHDRWCEVMSCSWAMDAPYSQRTGKVGDGKTGPLTISKPIDKATPLLMERMYNGGVIPRLEIEFIGRNADTGERELYMKYELRNVQISSYSVSTADGDQRGLESFSLNYENIRVTYFPLHGNDTDFMGPWK